MLNFAGFIAVTFLRPAAFICVISFCFFDNIKRFNLLQFCGKIVKHILTLILIKHSRRSGKRATREFKKRDRN